VRIDGLVLCEPVIAGQDRDYRLLGNDLDPKVGQLFGAEKGNVKPAMYKFVRECRRVVA
jgi:hypothetical protein